MAEQIKAALLRRKQVTTLTGLSTSTIYERVAKKTFPAQIRISSHTVAWRAEDVSEWLKDPFGYRAPGAA